ncbi:hypothetical protein [Pedobacter sp. BMA]|uniref:hypothetical protein n=1 Tax=Pedobacter sp. BMA TaxID=1663685 RepID=UPI000649A284|nr:hypothetical protein [Pedobacter sp. BMA]KLT64695.1 hypothetical protein AB669_13135 [Pedobacter sp. BMA]
MSFNEIRYQEFSAIDFTEIYIKQHPEVLKLEHIVISNANWTIYPPDNKMPPNAVFYSLPKAIKEFKWLKTLSLKGVFLIELPTELQELSDLKHLSIQLAEKSDIKGICTTLIKVEKLETLNLTGSIISDEIYHKIKQELPNVKLSDVIRNMRNKVNKNN